MLDSIHRRGAENVDKSRSSIKFLKKISRICTLALQRLQPFLPEGGFSNPPKALTPARSAGAAFSDILLDPYPEKCFTLLERVISQWL
jgi:hypothetical protein